MIDEPVITEPKRGFIRAIWKHLRDWSAEYSVLILTMLSVAFSAELYYVLTGRRPEENMTWMIDYASRCIVIALAITFTSMARQAFDVWYTKEQLMDRPALAIAHGAKSVVIFLACLYVLTH